MSDVQFYCIMALVVILLAQSLICWYLVWVIVQQKARIAELKRRPIGTVTSVMETHEGLLIQGRIDDQDVLKRLRLQDLMFTWGPHQLLVLGNGLDRSTYKHKDERRPLEWLDADGGKIETSEWRAANPRLAKGDE